MPETPIIRSRAGAQRAGAQAGTTLPALRVRYFNRMRPNRVYPVQVGWRGSRKGGEGGGPVQVRLIMAGAQVVPAEHTLDPGEPSAKVTFYVTPLAKGPLRGERAEVLQNGRKVGELRTPAKVRTQRMSWVLLALTLLVPWLLLQYFTSPQWVLDTTGPARQPTEVERKRIDALNERREKNQLSPNEQKELENLENATTGTVPLKLTDGKVLEYRIRQVSPEIPHQVEEYAGKEVATRITDIPEVIGAYYTTGRSEYGKYNVPFWAFWGLLLLTLLSYLWHREARRTRVGQPIELTE
jgi:hypothetical protein